MRLVILGRVLWALLLAYGVLCIGQYVGEHVGRAMALAKLGQL